MLDARVLHVFSNEQCRNEQLVQFCLRSVILSFSPIQWFSVARESRISGQLTTIYPRLFSQSPDSVAPFLFCLFCILFKMRGIICSLSTFLSLVAAAIIPGLDGIAGLGGALGGTVPAPSPAPAPAPAPAPIPASNIIPPDPATRPDLPDPNTPPPVLNRPDLPPGSAIPGSNVVMGVPEDLIPENSTLSPPFKLYVIPSQFTPFEYTFKNSFFGAYDVPAFLGPDGGLGVPTASTAGTFTILQPQGLLLSLSLSPPVPTYFSAPLSSLPYTYAPLTFANPLDTITNPTLTPIPDPDLQTDPNSSSTPQTVETTFSLGVSGAGLGTGLPAGFGVTNPKLGFVNEEFETGDKEARFCALMRDGGKKWVFGEVVRVFGRESSGQGEEEGCFGVRVYAQVL
ncbi:hypothetical protein ONS95_005248 [Cadophora gregata]|uniref:uncharacterized protein n=1 Tax=Cadophora gregata TaxID=51156 RepID=UPI0026DB1BD1|nr:uncharacterized protein ONS95_005248 [Cadophora gregata]KAK0103214.1 hypothetical protein ONS95_005248 [Cadophora gregata]KAK0107401.1 hypothetical protein ONS96_003220 [Cadophora gregata f. sp. sojae]